MYFLLNLNNCVKSYGHFLSNFSSFYDAHSPNIIMPCDLILGKFIKFLVEKLSTSEVIDQKAHGEGGGNHPP